MIRKTFITKPLANEERYRAFLANNIKQHEDKTSKNRKDCPEITKHLCTFNNDQYEEIVI